MFPSVLQTFQLTVNVRKPVLQRVLLLLKQIFAILRRQFIPGRKPPKAAAKAAPAGHAQSKTKPKTCAVDEFPCAGAWP